MATLFPQTQPLHRFSPNFQGMFTLRGSKADLWVGFIIHLKTKISQSSLVIQGPPKRSGLLYPVFSVKERYRKGGKCKISWVLQSPVFSPQASPKMEASNRPKQTQHLPTSRKV